jgi:hypothetical protein
MTIRTPKISLKDIKDEVEQIKRRNPSLREDAAFAYLFLKAYLVETDDEAKKSLTGVTGDKGVDAVFIDDRQKQISLIQSKFHQSEGFREKRNDVLALADLTNIIWGDSNTLEAYFNKVDPLVRDKFEKILPLIRKRNYELKLYYITTGTCSDTIVNESEDRIRAAPGNTEIKIIDLDFLLTIYKDYIEDVAPHVPVLKLRIVSEGAIKHEGIIRRFDPTKGIETWVFSMSGKDVGEMYSIVGDRLFARNIRGYKGATDINSSIALTIKKEPHNFWYYNNGVTIVCDKAKLVQEHGEDVLIVENGQVINGQQTTRTLHDYDSAGTNILVKVIKIPRSGGAEQEYDKLVNSVVRATNWQNHIESSDLISNEYVQIALEREFRKVGYQYIRKSMDKSEAKRIYGQGYFQIDKRDLAQSVAACLYDPATLRKIGKNGLFEPPFYDNIFGTVSLPFFLPKYILTKFSKYTASGYPERAYAKWLVLHFAWKMLSNEIGSGSGEKRFRYLWERYDYNAHKASRALVRALEDIFRTALRFYRAKRGKGEEAKDVSSFFALSGLHTDFEKYWFSSNNPYRKRVTKNIEIFKEGLQEIDTEQ